MSDATRVLLTGWFSFVHGEVTAGDVLAAEAVERALTDAAIDYRTAWSPVFRPDALPLDGADPAHYSHVVFVCGPVHSRSRHRDAPAPLLELHRRFARCRRIAVGVSVPDPEDPAAALFDVLLPRDGAGPTPSRPDLSVGAAPRPLPLVGVVLTGQQREYGHRRRHEEIGRALDPWLRGLDAALLPLDTRLDSHDWRLASTPDQLHSVLARLDALITTRLHGLVLALRAGVPALAIDPVDEGAKVTAQADVLGWPCVLSPGQVGPDVLDRSLAWCLSAAGREHAHLCRTRATTAPSGGDTLTELLTHLR
ncbi:polysaccharide pyruvyl transferase family protein [Streptomyces sp. 8N706]|uniref:polysaccharide pyruvyl transferase family protein n=1 Tax=Streptomyces sp. 8N706 TaxID=3457416 RepID=UPI003FD083C2